MITATSIMTKKRLHTWLLTGCLACTDPGLQAHAQTHAEFLQALTPLLIDQPLKARTLLQQRLQAYPNWQRGRLEAARLDYQLGDYQAAAAKVAQVLQEDLPAQVRRNVELFDHKIQQALLVPPQYWSWRGRFMLGGGWDSNANTGPTGTDIGVSEVKLKSSATQSQDEYTLAQISLDIERPLGEVTQRLQWNNQLNLFTRNYSQQTDVNISSFRWRTGIEKQQAAWHYGADIELQYLKYGNQDIRYIEIHPFVGWQQAAHKIELKTQLSQRNYLNQGVLGKDGYIRSYTLEYQYAWSKNWLMKGEFTWNDAQYQDLRYAYQAWELDYRVLYSYQNYLNLWSQVRYRNSHYQAPEYPLYDDERREDYWTWRLGAQYKLTPSVDIEVIWSNYWNQANHLLHDYQRQQVEARLAWLF
ncbi:hypothetical protein SAMN05421831_10674 [Allopseudospirillum japonicum]|uniref:Outer membrane protein beta-barrel domain-containing protein n=1 Tax=Allopseudospirillum japonicum TaxID=64971 RepID=A0A1H6S8S1_9GAMM|nr:hypothetical protein [Allopseudospirillum japonicum]SEI64508.1 hypothetical protein SAMN05421831_10674 [Allopseudospirillum japonicum]